ncbi:M4 family metallopeptidase, partial [Kitasatospora sp. NPDC058263]
SSAPAGTTGTGAAKGTATGAAAGVEPATGTAPDFFGRPVKVDIGRLPDGSYQFSDLTRPAAVTTYDAAGEGVGPGLPTDLAVVHAPGPDFPAATGTVGATDAHVNAGIVYDFYRDRLGRDGLDGKAGPIISVVNATAWGEPLANASWDGSKMVYGGGNDKFRPFSVALDVVGHEMTHGVVENTAGLLMAGQTGAMDEALADYFGNAIEVTARGIPMTDPKAGLLGENLCRTGTPEACAGSRRLDNHRTTVDDYLGVPTDVDSGGVHLNSTIFSGALWDIRRTLDPLTADRVIYRALAAYLTPLDDFVDGRNAVLAAGRSLGLSRAELRTVAAAFDAHGIRAGWQSRVRTDSRPLLRGAMAPTGPAAGGGHWVMGSTSGPVGGAVPLYTGSTTAPSTPTRLSPEDERIHGWAATDGTSAVWLAIGLDDTGTWGTEVLTRSLSGGPVRSLFKSSAQSPVSVQVSGTDIAFVLTDGDTGRSRAMLSHDGAPPVELPLPEGHNLVPYTSSSLSLRNGLLGWLETWTTGESTVQAPTVYSIAAGRTTAQYPVSTSNGAEAPFLDSPTLAGDRLLWTQTAPGQPGGGAIRSGALNGSGVGELLPAGSPLAPADLAITATDRAVTFQ